MGAFSIWHGLILILVLLLGFGVGVMARNACARSQRIAPRAIYGGARKLGIDRARPKTRRAVKPWARGRWRTTAVTLAVWAVPVTLHVRGFVDADHALLAWLGFFLGGGALLTFVIWRIVYRDPSKPLLYNVPPGACITGGMMKTYLKSRMAGVWALRDMGFTLVE